MTLNLKTPFPTFGGSTGGWLRAAEVEEKYAITWTSLKEQIFEMPTGGSAIMRNGENLLYLARKEQCLALSTQLRTMEDTDLYPTFVDNYCSAVVIIFDIKYCII